VDTRSEWESLCHERLPLGQLPPFTPLVIAISLASTEDAHFHDAVMDCVRSVAQPKRTFGEVLRPGAVKFTFMFFPERDADQLLAALRERLAQLPAGIALSSIEKVDVESDHRGFGKWRTDGVPYFIWAWDTNTDMLLSEQAQLASMPLKFNGDVLVRLRDIASIQAGMRPPAK
jgi:hypothetical protein